MRLGVLLPFQIKTFYIRYILILFQRVDLLKIWKIWDFLGRILEYIIPY